MKIWDRHDKICDLAYSEGEMSIAELATKLETTQVTIRKDVQELCAQGRIERRHGVIRPAAGASLRYSLQREMKVNEAQKELIARAAVEMVHEGEAVFIGPGSTCAAIMKKLIKKNNIVIITNAVNFEPLLENKSNSRIIFLGGEYSFTQGAVMGIISLDTLDSLNIAKFFLGANAVSAEDGLTSENLNDTGFIKMMMERSKEIIAVADHSKFGKTAAFRLIPIDKLDKIITDSGINEREKTNIIDRGVTLIIV